MTRSDVSTDYSRRRARRRLAVLAVLAVMMLALVAAGVWLAVRQFDGRRPAPTSPPPSPAAGRTTGDAVESRRMEWQEVAGVRLPFSPVHGPRFTGNGRAAGYSHSRQGAAVAAVQVLARTSPSAGPDVYRPVVAEQVVGSDAAAMADALDQQYEQLRAQASTPVAEGEPLPDNDASVAGYVVTAYDEGVAHVDVLLTAPQLAGGQVVGFAVTLQWVDGDWRAVAPPAGDWGTVSQLLATAPDGMLDYQAVV